MKFQKTTKYAIKLLAYLAQHTSCDNETRVDIKSTSKMLDIPYKYLSVLTTELAKAGLIDTTKGRHGGIKLTKGTTDMSIADILAAIGEPQIKTECIMGFGKCAHHGTCKLHTKIVSSILALKQAFEKTTLAEMVG